MYNCGTQPVWILRCAVKRQAHASVYAVQMDLETLMSEDEAAACNAQLLSATLNAQLHVQYVPANTFNNSAAGDDS